MCENIIMKNTERIIEDLKNIGFTEEAEEIFDYYLSIDCIDNLDIVGLIGKISTKL